MLVAAAAARLRSTRSLPRARPLTMGRRSRAARNRVLTPREVVTLQRTPGGVPDVAKCFPEEYDAQLRAKVQQLETQLASAVGAHQTALPPTETFESERSHFRMRASFAMWREGRDPTTLHYVMYERGDSKTPHEVTSFPMGSRRINELMTPLRDGLAAELVLHERIGDARFLTTTTGDAGNDRNETRRNERCETDETTARARDRRHVVLPPDIAKLLPKNRLLTEVRARDGDGGGRDGSTTRARRRDSFPRETKED